jgi:hypothetical protein
MSVFHASILPTYEMMYCNVIHCIQYKKKNLQDYSLQVEVFEYESDAPISDLSSDWRKEDRTTS